MPNAMVVDLSHHNAHVDFVKLKAAGVVGVIHKATQGTKFADSMYTPRRAQAHAAGLLWGAYHFATGEDVAAQEEYFLTHAQPERGDLFAIDFEPNGADTMSLAQLRDYLHRIDTDLGRPAVVYGGSLLKQTLGQTHDAFLGSHRLWWAQYGPAASIQASWQHYYLWQHSDGVNGPTPHQVDGVGPCDCDTYDGTPAQLKASWSGKP